MPTMAQTIANTANAQHSTGPKTEAGKTASSFNHLSHGLTGTAFTVLDWEDQNAFHALFSRVQSEHQPATVTEEILVEKMAQHYWLTQRAITLQATCFNSEIAPENPEKQLALYLRYQTTHDRAFHRSLDRLLKLRAEKRKQEIGFESQARKEAEEIRRRSREERKQNDELRKLADQTRREAAENRKQHMHRIDVLLAEAKLDHQMLLTCNLRHNNALALYRQEEEEQDKQQSLNTRQAA
jgi:low affinity Fe/Cu permease